MAFAYGCLRFSQSRMGDRRKEEPGGWRFLQAEGHNTLVVPHCNGSSDDTNMQCSLNAVVLLNRTSTDRVR